MDVERWQKVTELFNQLSALPINQREPALLRHCPDDPALRHEVLSLLDAEQNHVDFLTSPVRVEAEAALAKHFSRRWQGQTLGDWTIHAMIGEGGMGAVFRASRQIGDAEQQAAVKLIRTGQESSLLIERFAREQGMLARLNHPHIARLLDGGSSSDGVPWLAMELIEGEPIDQWVEQRQLSIEQRLELFDQVCQAVHYAHQNLIIHRDLKPSNILVTESGQTKLLDFGIAKLVAEDAIGGHTGTHQRMLTPSSASPEQFLGLPVTTASDVYALGLLLYRLLCGQPAYQIDQTSSAADLLRLICRDNPTRPSQAVARTDGTRTLARSARPRRLSRQLRGDLDTIVLKALRKEPERRYGSVEEMAEDLRRYRKGMPVQARPDSAAYRARKFLGRHWAGVSATAMVLLALTVGLGLALWQSEQLRTERDRTLRVNEFLQAILIEADPYQAGAEATIRDVLRSASTMITDRFSEQPAIEAPLRHTIGYTQLSLMELDASLENLSRADQLNRQLYGDLDDRTLMTQAYMAWIDYRRGHPAQAAASYRAILDRLGPRHSHATRATLHNDFGVILSEMERWEEALEHQRYALDIWLAHEPDRAEVGVAYNNIAFNLHGQGLLDEAREWYQRALEYQRRKASDGVSVDLAYNLNNLGALMRDMGRPEDALRYSRESLAMRIATLGADHAFTGFGHLNLGRLLLELDRFDEALPELEQAVRISEATLEPNQIQVLVARASLARAQALSGETVVARTALIDTVAIMREEQVPDNLLTQAEAWLEELGESGGVSAEHGHP